MTHSCASLACALLVLTASVPASAGGGPKPDRDAGPLVVLRGRLLEAGGPDAPFAAPGPAVGRFVLRSSDRGDLRVDPGVARLSVRGGALRARAADPSEDVGGLLELCRLGISPFPCLPLRPSPGYGDAQGTYFPLVQLNAELTSEEQARFGCGPFYGTVCDDAMLLPLGEPGAGNARFGRRDFLWTGLGPDGEYDRRIDRGVVLPGSRLPLGPEVGFPSEMAVLSWNAIMALVATSMPPEWVVDRDCVDAGGTPESCLISTDQDGDGLPDSDLVREDEFDPNDPFRADGCSFANPGLCANVRVIGPVVGSGWKFSELEGDPRGGERLRWLWESAIAYDVVHARGELAAFRDGRLYVYGPFESPIEGSASGVGLLLVPPAGAVPDAASPMLRIVPGPDRTLGTDDDGVVGLAWGATWPSEPLRRVRLLGRRGARTLGRP